MFQISGLWRKYSFRPTIFCVICIGLLWPRISASADIVTLSRSGSDVYISGGMYPDMLTSIERENWVGVKRIYFSSLGGSPIVALDIAERLKSFHIPIYIHDICVSACMYVLAIKGNVYLMPQTIVAIHNTPLSQFYIASKAYPKIARYLQFWAYREIKWYSEQVVDSKIFLMAEYSIYPRCVHADSDRLEDFNSLTIPTKFLFWAPSAEVLRKFGFRIEGEWSQNTDTVIRNVRQRYPRADLSRLTTDIRDGVASINIQRYIDTLESTPVCKR